MLAPTIDDLIEAGSVFARTLLVVAEWMTAQPADVLRWAIALQDATRAEPGCLGFHVAVDIDDPSVLRVVERYADINAFAAHRQSPHFLSIMQGEIAPRLTNRSVLVHEL